MIKPIKNNIAFSGSNYKNNLRKVKQSDYATASSFSQKVDYSKYKQPKKIHVIPVVSGGLAAIMLLTTGGVVRTKVGKDNYTDIFEPQQAFVVSANNSSKEITPEEAIETIKQSENLKQVYGDMVETLENMEKTIDNPAKTIQDILKEPYAEGVELEFVLPQIFCESSGNHYDSNGEVKQSYAMCNGWMQLSEGTTCDMNKAYFANDKKDRNNPKDNLELGISYNSEMLKYFDGDLFKALAAYNCGPGNVQQGKNYGDEYAQKIINYYNVLKNNPKFTQMLLAGEFDHCKNDFLYN